MSQAETLSSTSLVNFLQPTLQQAVLVAPLWGCTGAAGYARNIPATTKDELESSYEAQSFLDSIKEPKTELKLVYSWRPLR